MLTGIVLGVVGFYLGWWVGHQIHATSYAYFADTGQNDIALMFGYLFFVIGFLVGLGFAKYPLARMLGREPSHHENEGGGIRRYFGALHRPQGGRPAVPGRDRRSSSSSGG